MLIPTFAINLKDRIDRYEHIKRQFANKPEFNLNIIEAHKHTCGALGLWTTIKQLLTFQIKEKLEDFIIICEDDHLFTPHYSLELLFENILQAKNKKADILLGGISWFQTAIPVSENLLWVQRFSGLQFTIIFKHFYKTILETEFRIGDDADYKISDLSNRKFVIHPYISVQKDFGYSDVTLKNNTEGRVDLLFKHSSDSLKTIKSVSKFYDLFYSKKNITELEYDKITIPTYVINLSGNKENLERVKYQFKHKYEFNISISNVLPEVASLNLWKVIVKIISIAKKMNEDVIIISYEDHMFTKYYSKKYLLQNIVKSYSRGADLLIGGCEDFIHLLPIDKNLYWVSQYLSARFLVIFKKFYQKILDEPYDNAKDIDLFFSQITGSKILLYPFVSSKMGVENNILEKNKRRIKQINSYCSHKIRIHSI